jgi:AcrR family transcriptional regulator
MTDVQEVRIADVGHREDLLAGAKRCLFEKGYARTTARDIVAASGTNLASIGYHYGSKEALLNLALFDALNEFGEQVAQAMAEAGPAAGPPERFAAFWARVLAAFEEHRHLWGATFEIYHQINRMPELRKMVAEGTEDARRSWARLIQGIDPAAEPGRAHAVGSIYQALLAGVLAQWLTDPEHAPSAAELAEGLRSIAAGFDRADAPGPG